MHYFLGVLVLGILAYACPKFLAIFVAFIVLSALVVKVSAKCVINSDPPLLSCIKAVIYSFICAAIVVVIIFKLMSLLPLAILTVGSSVLMLWVQSWVYSSTLSLTMRGGFAVSICVIFLAGVLGQLNQAIDGPAVYDYVIRAFS